MRIDGSCRCLLRPSVNQTLAWMARGVEDGDVSDGDSLEEITAEDFRQDARGSRSRVLVPDTMSYPPSTSLTSDPLCFAWPPAVGNKPLGFGGKSVGSAGRDSAMGEPCVVVIEDSSEDSCSEVEEEEGELDDAEIDLGSELAAGGVIELEEESEVKGSGEMGSGEKQLEEMGNFDESMKRILQDLGMITAGEAEPSIDAVCSQLRKMFSGSCARAPVVGSLAQPAFMGVQTVHSVATSGKSMKVEPKEVLLLRLLLHIKDNFSGVLAPELLKEINAMVQYWASECAAKGISPHDCSSLETPYPEPRAVNYVVSNCGQAGLPNWETPFAVRNRVELNPLLDHDADDIHGNLPSPSREKPIGFGTGAVIATRPMAPMNGETEGYALRHAYDNHAFRVVSSYHQKHSPTSFLGSNQLPSPTPSDECDDVEDAHGEVSSSWIGDNTRTLNSASSLQLQMASNVMAKSRHPRLRILNPEVVCTPDPNRRSMHVDPNAPNGLAREIVDSRKHKAVDDVQVDHVLKRHRNGFKDSQPSEMIRLNGNGEIVSSETVTANINGTNGGIMKNTSMSTAPAVQLPSLLKDISVNHTRLMQLIKTKQHELAAQAQQKTADPAHDATFFSSANRLTRTVSSANGGSVKSSEVEQNPAVKPQLPSLTASMNDVGRISVKSRDPCGILQRVGLNSEPTKVNGNLSSDTSSSNELFVVRDQGEQAQMACLASQNTAQPIRSKKSKVDAKSSTADSNGHKSVSAFLCEGGTKGASQAPNQWEDVNHLLDGFDDHERAAIWKERARRIEEQYKMFAERKLCLVLDLDHTLLNSAKFEDIDPVQYEKLMKREEKERHKSVRHLFRLQHMGMWTKLRPGIWKFLERASKLYELHLYTMGNKLYATEMAKVLDPTGNLFAGRVISRGHVGDAPDGDDRASRIKDLDGVLGMESAVVIIDDSVRVWPYNRRNLIAVERYLYFPCSRRQFGLRGPSLLEIGHDERAENGTLASSLSVIERIHHNFFSHGSLDDVDVRNMLAAEQRKILAGCRIVFSRIFPVGEAEPQLHPLWQTAQQFGAVCTNQIDEQVTHVVANSPGTDKVNWALSAGRFVVKPGWVEASALLYRRANEHHFAIKL